MKRMFLLVAALFLGGASGALAQPPNDMAYQGLLRDSGGQPLAGPVNLEVGIWDAATAGSALYRESHTGVPLQGGVFNLLVGTGSVITGAIGPNTFSAPDRYLEVIVNGETLAPRQAISSAPFALRAATAESVEGGSGISSSFTNFTNFSINNAGFVHNEGTATVSCSSGFTASGGGFSTSSDCLRLKQSYPNGTGWTVRLLNECNFHNASVNVWARCIPTAP